MSTMRRFRLCRPCRIGAPPVIGAEPQLHRGGYVADGVLFFDGTAVLRWKGDHRSTVVYESMADLRAVHVDPHVDSTMIEWQDGCCCLCGAPELIPGAGWCECCGASWTSLPPADYADSKVPPMAGFEAAFRGRYGTTLDPTAGLCKMPEPKAPRETDPALGAPSIVNGDAAEHRHELASETPVPIALNASLGSNRPERSDGNALSSVLDLPCHYCRQTTCQCLGKGALIAERDTLKAENETLRHDHEEELAFLWEEYAEADPAILTPKAAKFGARLRTIAGYDILSAANKQLQAENEKLRWAGETLLWTLRADGDDPETEWGCNCEDNDEYDAARGGRCPYCRLVAAELIEAGKTSGAPLVRVQVSRRLAQTLGIEGPALPTQIRSIAAAVLQCAEGWEPQARLIGNVTAAELVSFARAVLLAPTDDSGEPLSESLANLTEEQQVALATQACLAHNGDQVESYEDPFEDDEEETVEEMLERYREQDDEARSRRGTSECDGLCDPQCNWCLVGHNCPEDCGGGEECPYVTLAAEETVRTRASRPSIDNEASDVIARSAATETPDLDPSNNPVTSEDSK